MFQGMRYVLAVWQEGSFSRAAEKLFISQPSLSASIRREEEAVGAPIFDRSVKPLKLTPCGEEYVRAAEQILSVQQQFDTYLNDTGELKTGSLAIGGSNLYASWVLPELLSRFSSRYPGIKIELTEESSRELEHLLQNGTIDLMLDNAALDPSVYDRQIYREETLLLAVPEEFPVNQAQKSRQIPLEAVLDGSFHSSRFSPASLQAFRGIPFILMKPDNDTGERAIAICRENAFQPKVLFRLDQQMTSYNIAISGMGAAFISDTLIRQVPFRGRIALYKLDSQHTRRHLSFWWKRGRYQSKAMQAFLESCR